MPSMVPKIRGVILCWHFALANALHALGLPGWLAPDQRHLALSADIAAARLHAAFERTEAHRVYLCPLDKADVLPQLNFGPNRRGRLTAAELEELIDASRLRRTFPNRAFDGRRFSQFTWLVIRENESVDRKPAEQQYLCFLNRRAKTGAQSSRAGAASPLPL